jgi:hypothetical protein
MKRTALALCLVVAALPTGNILAQTATRRSFDPVSWSQEFSKETSDDPGLLPRIGSALGGAVLGAGLGFFVSHVIMGDWTDQGGHQIDRSLWATVGGSVGLAVAFSFPLSSQRGGDPRGLPLGRDYIGAGELLAHGVANAYQAVTLLRPEWTQIRGEQSLEGGLDPVIIGGRGEVISGTVLPSEASTIQVYLDDLNIGGIEALHTVEVALIRGIYFFNAAKATVRWGGRNPQGAILIIT